MEEPSLHAEEWFRIKGRGFVASIKERYPETLYDPNEYTDRTVKINDERFLCKGAETFAIPRSKEHPYKFTFCLLVKEIEVLPQTVPKPKKKTSNAETVEDEDWVATFIDEDPKPKNKKDLHPK